MEVTRMTRKLPKNPKKGKEYTIKTNPGGNLGKRIVTFIATGKKGFGKFRIKSNKPAK